MQLRRPPRPLHGRFAVRALLAALAASVAASAQAGPVSTSVELVIRIADEIPISYSGTGTVTVSGSTVHIPAGLIQASQIIVPVSAVSSYGTLLMLNNLSNLAGTFRIGGVASQAPGEVCPGTSATSAGFACNVGGGFGGVLPLLGTLSVPIVTGLITFPYDLAAMGVGQGGGSTNLPVGGVADGAAWSTGPGRIGTASGALTVAASGSGLVLVSPIFLANTPFNDGWGALIPITATLTLGDVFLVPEPVSLLLLGAGVAGLLLLRRRVP